jgi:hypothetical protein
VILPRRQSFEAHAIRPDSLLPVALVHSVLLNGPLISFHCFRPWAGRIELVKTFTSFRRKTSRFGSLNRRIMVGSA